MYSRRKSFIERLPRLAAFLLAALALAAAVGPSLLSFSLAPVAHAQDGRETFEQLRAELDQVERKENVQRILTFTLLSPYLPAGTRMTSGYRDPNEQLSLIRRMAINRGIISSNHNMTVNDPSTWSGALAGLHRAGVIIAAPYTTPHGRDAAVFDMSGPDLDGIVRGCRVAESKGMLKIARIIHEAVNHCIHVEIEWVNTRAFTVLSETRPRRVNLPGTPASGSAPPSSSSPPPGVSPTPDENAVKKGALLQELLSQHASFAAEPLKQVDIDRAIIQLLDPLTQLGDIQSREREIEEHLEKAKRNEEEAKTSEAAALKQEMSDNLNAAIREGRDEDALRYAQALKDRFPDEPEAKAYPQIKTRFLVKQAWDIFDEGECQECGNIGSVKCEKAANLIKEVLEAPDTLHDDPQALRTKEEMEAGRSKCRTERWARLILLVLLGVGLIIALYFVLRPGAYVLEGVLGPCQGEVFPLDKSRIRVGAVAPSEDEAVDIVISDRRHKISRVHCLLTQSGRHWYLKDESSNGTKVNDQPLEKGSYQRLQGGDEISLADEAVLLFRRR